MDRYQFGIYKSLATAASNGVCIPEAAQLSGFQFGNRVHPGCLTEDVTARLHSCEPGTTCSAMGSENIVLITPIITRTRSGTSVPELGAGGGWGDLGQTPELDLEDEASLKSLEELCVKEIQDPKALSSALEAISLAWKSETRRMPLKGLQIQDDDDEDGIPLPDVVKSLSRNRCIKRMQPKPRNRPKLIKGSSGRRLSNSIVGFLLPGTSRNC